MAALGVPGQVLVCASGQREQRGRLASWLVAVCTSTKILRSFGLDSGGSMDSSPCLHRLSRRWRSFRLGRML